MRVVRLIFELFFFGRAGVSVLRGRLPGSKRGIKKCIFEPSKRRYQVERAPREGSKSALSDPSKRRYQGERAQADKT